MELTEAQKNCPYCHVCNQMIEELDGTIEHLKKDILEPIVKSEVLKKMRFAYPISTEQGILICLVGDNDNSVKYGMVFDSRDNQWLHGVFPFDYCPKCGRHLTQTSGEDLEPLTLSLD